MPVTTSTTATGPGSRTHALQYQPSNQSSPVPPFNASVSTSSTPIPHPTSVTASAGRAPLSISALLSHPAVQAVGGALVILSLIKAAQYLAERYHLLPPSLSPSASSPPAPRGSHRSTNPYETPTQLHEYLLMHFAPPSLLLSHTDVPDVPWAATHFPAECARACVAQLKANPQWAAAGSKVRALDVGCAVGRASFELARHVGEVVALDFSHSFIAAANELKATGRKDYLVKVEGDITQKAVAEVHPAIDRSRVTFLQGDACALGAVSPPLGAFHVVLAANLLCRLPHPLRFLAALPALVVPQGYVLLFSPHTWLEEYTAKDHWLGGYYDAQGKEVRTSDRLKEVMEADGFFKLVETRNVPFFIRETYRKNQFNISHLMVFVRCPS